MGPFPNVDIPPALNDALCEVLATTQSLSPVDAVQSPVAARLPTDSLEEFVKALTNTLDRNGVACVTGIAPDCRYLVTALVAEALGGLTGAGPGPLGGEVTTVVTSTSFDHNLAWHTDSTSWELPNRWQTLTLVEPDAFDRPAPTSVLPWSTVLRILSPVAADELRMRTYGWREQFPALAPLSAPVLGNPPRWLRPALATSLDHHYGAQNAAIRELADVISRAEDIVDTFVTESSIVIFDNHAVLHRGPHLDPDGGRTIIRLKLGGIVGLLEPITPL